MAREGGDNFDLIAPLPYRVTWLIILAIWGWGFNIQVLHKYGIDVPLMLKIQSTGENLASGTLLLARRLSLALFASHITYLTFASLTSWRGLVLLPVGIFPWISFIAVISLLFITPNRRFLNHHPGLVKFRKVFLRILIGGLDLDCRLGDILLADVITSYSKVLVDIAIMTCMLFNGQSCIDQPDRSYGMGGYLVPFIGSIPFLIRLRQCSIDYLSTRDTLHIFNFFKYLSSIPVIVLSTMQGKTSDPEVVGDEYFSDDFIRQAWILAVLINSGYSFIWDVSYDWGLELLKNPQNALQGNALRPKLVFGTKKWYYTAIVLDYFLRFSWSVKLSPHWYSLADCESGVMVLELLEVFRRWVWIFFRIEYESTKSTKDYIELDLPK